MAHCTHCGAVLPEDGTHPTCASCGRTQWRNPAPAVGVAIVGEGKVLLARRALEPKAGAWDLLGGFIEPGEDAQEAARREVQEETGVEPGEMALMTVVPGDYGGRPTLNLLFLAQAPAEEPVAADDVAELRWFGMDGLPEDLAWDHEARFLRHLAQEWQKATQGP